MNISKGGGCRISSATWTLFLAGGADGAVTKRCNRAGIHFVREAFGRCKAITADKVGQMLWKTTKVGQNAGVVDASDKDALFTVAKPPMGPKKSVRTLA